MIPLEIKEAFTRLRAFAEKKPWAYRDTDHYPLRDLVNIERALIDARARLIAAAQPIGPLFGAKANWVITDKETA